MAASNSIEKHVDKKDSFSLDEVSKEWAVHQSALLGDPTRPPQEAQISFSS